MNLFISISKDASKYSFSHYLPALLHILTLNI